MKTIHQIEQELKQAKAAILNQQSSTLLSEFKQALEGKYFLLQWQWKDGQAVAVSRYSGFKPMSNSSDIIVRIEYKQEIATIQITRSRKTRRCFEPIGVTRTCSEYNSAHGLYDITTHHIKEITKAQFNAIWEIPLMMADIQIPKWLEITNSQMSEDLYKESEVGKEFVVDVPFVDISAPESFILNGSPYMLPNSRHLITPNAVAFARNRITYEEDMERRVAYLAEACDQRYLEAKRQTLLSLRSKFKI